MSRELRELSVAVERFPINGKFTISRGAKTEAAVVVVTVVDGGFRGRGECVPYSRYGESVESVVALIESVRASLENGCGREELSKLLPAGAARNAVDCALWDLEAKRAGRRVQELAGLPALKVEVTAYTISLDAPEAMAEAAAKADRPILKIKLGGAGGDLERIRAIRARVPQATIIADANEGWTPENLQAHFAACAEARLSLIEQPLPAASDEHLRGVKRLVPLCADESVHDRQSLERLKGLYDFVNIKLDKTGGLTEALAMARAARELGFGIMIGCMVGTSLAMAPALMLGGLARFVDLDGPLLLARDRENGLRYEGSRVFPPDAALWG